MTKKTANPEFRKLTVAAHKRLVEIAMQLPRGTMRRFTAYAHSDICEIRVDVSVHRMEMSDTAFVEYATRGGHGIHPEYATRVTGYPSLDVSDADCIEFLNAYPDVKRKLMRLCQEMNSLDLSEFVL